MRMTVIGTGYLGAVHAACMAQLGHEVLGVDVDASRVAALQSGRAPFYEPDFDALLDEMVRSGRLTFTTDLTLAAGFADLHFVCVGTPQTAGSLSADTRHVDAVIDVLGPQLSEAAVIVGKSTVPVGTSARLQARVRELRAQRGESDYASVVWNPEFLREGMAVQDTRHPDRIVVGTASGRGAAVLRALYEPMRTSGSGYIETDWATAELVKVAANSFLATKISFINAMSEICEATGADAATLAHAIGQDDRIGTRFLRAGVGFGGGCLPKDIRAFVARADELGVGQALDFLRDVDDINLRARSRVVSLATEMLGGCAAGAVIGVLGATFKPESDDVRDSPALHVAQALRDAGAAVRVHDPRGLDNARQYRPDLDYTHDIEKAVEGAELVLHLTEWSDYRDLDPVPLASFTARPALLDARGGLDIDRWRAGGWRVRTLGRPLR